MSTEKKVISKLTVKTDYQMLTLLVFAHGSGVLSYHVMANVSRANRSLDELNLTKPLPCVKYDYDSVKELVDVVVGVIDSAIERKVTSRKDYFTELS